MIVRLVVLCAIFQWLAISAFALHIPNFSPRLDSIPTPFNTADPYFNSREHSAIYVPDTAQIRTHLSSDTAKRKPIKLLSSAGDTPLSMRHQQYLYLFSLLNPQSSEKPQTQAEKAQISNQLSAKNEGITSTKNENKPKKDSLKSQFDSTALPKFENPEHDFASSSLMISIAKKEIGKNIYWLISFYVIWLILKLTFPIYHRKILQFTERAVFRLSSNRNDAILANFQLELVFFRIFSLLVYTYLIIIYCEYYPSIAYFFANDYWIFPKIFTIFSSFYILRFLLISFWNNKYLQRSQIMLNSIYSTGFSIYFLIIATIFTFLNPQSDWYIWVHIGIFCTFLYFLFSKAVIILREYLKNNHRVDFYLLCYLVLFEFSVPVALLYLSILF